MMNIWIILTVSSHNHKHKHHVTDDLHTTYNTLCLCYYFRSYYGATWIFGHFCVLLLFTIIWWLKKPYAAVVWNISAHIYALWIFSAWTLFSWPWVCCFLLITVNIFFSNPIKYFILFLHKLHEMNNDECHKWNLFHV